MVEFMLQALRVTVIGAGIVIVLGLTTGFVWSLASLAFGNGRW